MSHQLDERGRTEYPFPVMDAVEPSSSSSNSLTSRSRTSNSRSRRSSPSTLSRHRSRVERDGDNVQVGSPSKLFTRLMSREHHESKSVRALLVLTTERLEGETRRADEAERRVVETLRRLRSAHEATMLAQADAARASEELRQYKYRLEEAQREIHKAQEILNQIEQEKAELEAEAARARSTARKYREERLMARAREEGRQDGYQEGFSRGKNLSYQEARATTQARGRDLNRRMTEGEDEEETESGDGDYNRRSPVPIPVRRDIRPPSQPIWRPPSRPINSRASQRSPPHVSDVAPHAAILPVQTITTPLNAPSPSHASPSTPTPAHMPNPTANARDEVVPLPIPIRQPAPSPTHPPFVIPPEGWIPYADNDRTMSIPAPHELSRPVSPNSPSPPLLDPSGPAQGAAFDASIHLRDYADSAEAIPVQMARSAPSVMSPISKASTRLSQYDLVSPPRDSGSQRKTSVAGRTTREDRRARSPRGPRPRDELPNSMPSPFAGGGTPNRSAGRERSSSNPLERLFKKRFRDRTSGGSGGIPEIVVESPTTATSSRSSTTVTVTQPHLLSPELTQTPLYAPQDVMVMSVEVPQTYYGIPLENRQLTPLSGLNLATPGLLSTLPPGFSPFSDTTTLTSLERIQNADGHMQKPAGSPTAPRYAEAPIPDGIVYPGPPGKLGKRTPNVAAGVPLPPSPANTPSSPRRRRGSPVRHLSPLRFSTPQSQD